LGDGSRRDPRKAAWRICPSSASTAPWESWPLSWSGRSLSWAGRSRHGADGSLHGGLQPPRSACEPTPGERQGKHHQRGPAPSVSILQSPTWEESSMRRHAAKTPIMSVSARQPPRRRSGNPVNGYAKPMTLFTLKMWSARTSVHSSRIKILGFITSERKCKPRFANCVTRSCVWRTRTWRWRTSPMRPMMQGNWYRTALDRPRRRVRKSSFSINFPPRTGCKNWSTGASQLALMPRSKFAVVHFSISGGW